MKRLLDPLDERIITELTLNSRISHAELASKINLSRNAVRQRIERLERDGGITAYTIRTGDGTVQRSMINAVIFVYRHDRMRGTDVILGLKEISEVIRCDVMSGEFDLMVHVRASTPERVHGVWGEISAMSGVENTVTSFVLSSLV
jgi:DNA-binding Lrp family transcriptional regulator